MRKIIICLLLPFTAFADSCTDAAAQTISNSYEQVAARWSAAIVSTMPGPNSSFGTGYFYVGTGVTPPPEISIYRELGWDFEEISTAVGETDGISTNWYVHSLNGVPVSVGGDGALSRSLTLSLNNSVNALSGLSCGSSDSTNCCCSAEINSIVSVVESASGDIRNSIAVAVEQINSKMFAEINDVRRNQYTLNSVVTNGFANVNARLSSIVDLFGDANTKLDSIETILQDIASQNPQVDLTQVIAAIDGLKNSLATEVTQASILSVLQSWNQYVVQLNNLQTILTRINGISDDVNTIMSMVERPPWIDSDFWPAVTELVSAVSSNGVSDVNMGIVTNIYDSAIGSWSSASNFWFGMSEGFGLRPEIFATFVGGYFDIDQNWDFYNAAQGFWETFESENYDTIKSYFLDSPGLTLSAVQSIPAYLQLYEYAKSYRILDSETNSIPDVEAQAGEAKADLEHEYDALTNKFTISKSVQDFVSFETNVNLEVSVSPNFSFELISTENLSDANSAGLSVDSQNWVVNLNAGSSVGIDLHVLVERIREVLVILYKLIFGALLVVWIWGNLDKIIEDLKQIAAHVAYVCEKITKGFELLWKI